jgi:tetratricopeptide (TPR) repeat protein
MSESAPQKPGLKRIGELLTESGMLSESDLLKGLDYGKKTGMALGRVLTMMRLVPDADLRAALQVQSMMKFEGLPSALAVRSLRYMKENKVPIESACKQVGWQTDKFKGEVPPRLKELREKYADYEQRLGADHVDVADVLLGLAAFYEDEEMWAHAEANCQQAIEKLERALGPNHLKVAGALTKMGSLLFLQDRYEEAQALQLKAFEIKYNTLGADHLDVGKALFDLGEVCEVQQNFADAEKYYWRAIEIREKHHDIEEPLIIDSLQRLSFVCARRGRAPDQVLVGKLLIDSGLIAEEKIPEALNYSREKNVPMARALVALDLIDEQKLRIVLHAQLLIKSNLLPAPLAVRVLRLCARRKIGVDEGMAIVGWTPKVNSAHNIGELLSTYDSLLDAERVLAADAPEVGLLCLRLADLYESYERYAEAEPLYKRALAIIETKGERHTKLLTVLDKIGLMSLRQQNFEQAESIYQRVLDMRVEMHGPTHAEVALSHVGLGQMYIERGDHKLAIQHLQKALPIAEQEYGNEHALVGEIVDRLAVAYYETGDYDRAEPLFWRAFRTKREQQGAHGAEIAALLTKLADLYNKQGQYNMADSVLAMFKDGKSVII